ncbi:MAG: 2Fe-2S iron-sulfur cluster-binding protein, partial [Rhodospirillales bacterium]|nr:2Fe-2S iron-sulfur cluster-binding protein [Rhodospirillales bacterium]
MRTDARIRVEGTDLAFDAASDQPVLDSALDAGIRLPHNCRGGICGTCRATVLSGTPAAERRFQHALTKRER